MVGVRENTPCDLENSYLALNNRGALALVSIVSTKWPGIFCYRHQSLNPWALANHDLVLIEATKLSISGIKNSHGFYSHAQRVDKRFARVIDEWSAAASEEKLRLIISPPFDTWYESNFESIQWTLIFRALLPCYSLYTGVYAALQARQYHRKRAEWAPGRVICFAEAPIMVLITISLTCGLFGPQMFPVTMGNFLILLFAGFGHATTVLLVLFIREATRSLKRGVPRRNAWKLHRRKLLALALFLYLMEVSMVFFAFNWGHTARFKIVHVLILIAFIFVQIGVCLWYTYHAYNYVRPLQQYLRHPDSHPSSEHIAKCRSLVFFLYGYACTQPRLDS